MSVGRGVRDRMHALVGVSGVVAVLGRFFGFARAALCVVVVVTCGCGLRRVGGGWVNRFEIVAVVWFGWLLRASIASTDAGCVRFAPVGVVVRFFRVLLWAWRMARLLLVRVWGRFWFHLPAAVSVNGSPGLT